MNSYKPWIKTLTRNKGSWGLNLGPQNDGKALKCDKTPKHRTNSGATFNICFANIIHLTLRLNYESKGYVAQIYVLKKVQFEDHVFT